VLVKLIQVITTWWPALLQRLSGPHP